MAPVLHQLARLGLRWAARDSTGHHHGASQQNWDLTEIGWVGEGPSSGTSLTNWRSQQTSSYASVSSFVNMVQWW